MLKVRSWKLGAHVTVDITFLHDDFDENHYDIFRWWSLSNNGSIIACQKENNVIQNDGVVLAIGGQLLGQYYMRLPRHRRRLLWVFLNQTNNRFIGDIEMHNEEFDETTMVENHQFTFRMTKAHWDRLFWNGNNERKSVKVFTILRFLISRTYLQCKSALQRVTREK